MAMSKDFRVVDVVTRATAERLQATDATLAWDDEQVFVLEPRQDGDGDE